MYHSKLNKTEIKKKQGKPERKLSFKFAKMLTSHFTSSDFKTLEFHSLSVVTFTWVLERVTCQWARPPVVPPDRLTASSQAIIVIIIIITNITFIIVISYYGKPCPTSVHHWQGTVTMVNKVLVAMETLFWSNQLVHLLEFGTAVPPHQSTWFVCITCCFSCVLIFFYFAFSYLYDVQYVDGCGYFFLGC